MSRIRSIHPGFFTDERIVSTSVEARLLFLGVGVEADDKGIFEWKPITLKMRIFPADNVDVAERLDELESAGVIMAYEIEGRKYGAIRNFRRHQRPKTPNDIHPITPEIRSYVGLTSEASEKPAVKEPPFPPKGEKSPQMEDGGGKEGGKRKEEPNGSSKKRGSRLPEDWLPDETFARHEGLSASECEREAEKFRDYWRGLSGQRGVKADWAATWRNWVRKAVEGRRAKPAPSDDVDVGYVDYAPPTPEEAARWKAMGLS